MTDGGADMDEDWADEAGAQQMDRERDAREAARVHDDHQSLRALAERDAEAAEAEVICGQVESRCVCTEPPDHTTPHVCQCGGSWSGGTEGDPGFTIHSLPGSAEGYPSAIDLLFGGLW